MPRPTPALFALTACAAPALAGGPPVARSLMTINQALPNTFPPFAPTDFASATVVTNSTRGYAIKSTGGATDFIWGALQASPPSAGQFFALESLLPAPGIPSFLPRIGFDSTGATLFSGGTPWSLWQPAGAVASRPDPLPSPLATALGVSGKFYGQFLSTYGLSAGLPVWRATWQNTPDTSVTNTNVGYSIIRGYPNAAPVVLLATGMTPAGAPGPIGAGSDRGFDTESVGFARGNSNFIVEGQLDTVGGVTTDTNGIMILNGAVLQIGGGPVREDSPMLVDNQQADERWDNFSAADVNNNGNYLFLGDTISSAPGSFNSDQVLVVNGRVKLREAVTTLMFNGSPVTLGSNTGDAVINERGDWAVTWNTTSGSELIIVNGAVAVQTGVTQVDTDGDGVPDVTLTDIALRSDALALSDRRIFGAGGDDEIYFIGATGAGFTQGVYALTFVPPQCIADLNGDGLVGSADLAIVLGTWGPGDSIGDINNSGDVTAADLAIVLGSWGPCP